MKSSSPKSYGSDAWKLTESGITKSDIAKNQSVFSLGNGYLGFRGSFDERYEDLTWECCDGTYINGFYESEKIRYGEIAYGFAEDSQTMLNVANAKRVDILIDGEPIGMNRGTVVSHERSLDLACGKLVRSLRLRSPEGKEVFITSTRLVSMARKNIAAIEISITPLNFDGNIEVHTFLNGDVTNRVVADDPRVGSGLKGKVLRTCLLDGKANVATIVQKTKNSALTLAAATVNVVDFTDSGSILQQVSMPSNYIENLHKTDNPPIVEHAYSVFAKCGQTLTLNRYIAYVTDKDYDLANTDEKIEVNISEISEISENDEITDVADKIYITNESLAMESQACSTQVKDSDDRAPGDLNPGYIDSGSNDTEAYEALSSLALSLASEASSLGMPALLSEQSLYFSSFWKQVGIDAEGDVSIIQGLRFNLFHLLQSAGKDGASNISAKGLSGEGYEGHYFWDTEIYVIPFFIHANPEIAKQLLIYRYGILDTARRRAREMGHDTGALFPWRTIDGRECSAYYPAGTAQYHINADIAYAFNQYIACTGDQSFYENYAVEVYIETARLWFSLGFFNSNKDGKFCINGVTGPDEYNAVVDNNCYTNLMAKENLLYAIQGLNHLKNNAPPLYDDLTLRLDIKEAESMDWQVAAEKMYIPFDARTGLFPQDDGFMDRVPWDFKALPKSQFPLLLHYHPLVIYRHMVCKQADFVLALFLLGQAFTASEKLLNYDFYEKVTTHDSSLSKAVFCVLASELGKHDEALSSFNSTVRLDLDDNHGNTGDGLHMANMAGSWMGLVNGFGGMRIANGKLSLNPWLPGNLKSYCFNVTWRGALISTKVSVTDIVHELLEGDFAEFECRGLHVFLNDKKRKIKLSL